MGVDARVLWPLEALDELGVDDIALLRLDVLPTLDGIEPGLDVAPDLSRRGVRVLNRPSALIAAHDKLLTARRLEAAGVPHPETWHLETGQDLADVSVPCVVKPRFGSWGQDVFRCRTRAELEETLDLVADRPWFERHGALVQELVDSPRSDLRLVVAGGTIVAAAERRAAPGEWRTNVSLGGRTVPATFSESAHELALRSASAIGIDFAGVDLLPTPGGWTVLELNGAVDFDSRYALSGIDPYAAILSALGIDRPEPREIDLETKEEVMPKTVQGEPPRAGDEIVITGHSVGDAPRTALILDVLGEPGHERYHVRWEDGHESIFFPAEDAIVRHPERRRAKTR